MVRPRWFLLTLGTLAGLVGVTRGQFGSEPPVDLYCGDMNCYEVLGLSRDSPKTDVKSSYRKLAAKWHPDKFRDEEEKSVAEEKFRQIASAYEVLKDDDSRVEYNYMLDHPEEMWRNYYRYYSRRLAPKVDVRIVLFFTISVISAVQYYSAWSNYEEAIKYLVTVPKYRIQATEIAKEDGLMKRDKKADKGKSKEEIKQEDEKVIRSIIEEKMDIKGGFAKPTYRDMLWVQLVFLPYTLWTWTYFYTRWLWKFGIKREEYGEDEKVYVIRRNMGLSQLQFDAQYPAEEDVTDLLDQELWVYDNFKEWKQEKDDEMRIKMAQSGRYKQYRRYMKNHGPDRMTFDDS